MSVVAVGVLCACLPVYGANDGFPDEQGTIPVGAWDVVPHQVLDRPFHAGVVAFHEVSVTVRFSVWSADRHLAALDREVMAPSLNPRTRVWEYVCEVRPSEIPDGPFELRATCFPGGEGNREIQLQPLVLIANDGGTVRSGRTVYADSKAGQDNGAGTLDAPYRTLRAALNASGDGGTVLLGPGEYSPDALRGGENRERWTTIRPRPGAGRDEVHIGRGRPVTDKLRFQNVTLYADVRDGKYTPILSGEQGKTVIWLDDCVVHNRQGRWHGRVVVFGNRYPAYITGGRATQLQRAPGALLMRDYRIETISEDVFTDSKVAINCTVEGVDAGPTGGHADFHQSHVGDRRTFNAGVILYNCVGRDCRAQGFFGHNLKDSAFVNCLFVKTPDVPMLSQYSGKLDHVLFFHLTLPNQDWIWRGGLVARNCFMMNCILPGISISTREGADVSGITIASNHFLRADRSMGTDTTVGGGVFVDPAAGDYQARAEGAATGSGKPLVTVPADVAGTPWGGAPSRGCYTTPRP